MLLNIDTRKFGHVVRAKGTLANIIWQGKVEGKQNEESQQLNDVKEWTKLEWDVEGARGPCALEKACQCCPPPTQWTDWSMINNICGRRLVMLRTMFSLFMQCSGSLLLEQYMGRWHIVMIHGRLARFSGLFASCQGTYNTVQKHSQITCIKRRPINYKHGSLSSLFGVHKFWCMEWLLSLHHQYFVITIHHHWAAVVSRGWAQASACHLQLSCLVLFSARSCRSSICPGRLSTTWLVFVIWL